MKSQNYNSPAEQLKIRLRDPALKKITWRGKFKNKRLLKSAVDFHGHLGPYLVLGLLIGNLGIKALKAKKHFGIKAIVKGAIHKPKSCLVDGIQISAGCTYGKGNIQKIAGNRISVLFQNVKNNKKIRMDLKGRLINQLDNLRNHSDSEAFARKLLKAAPAELFELKF